MDELINKLILGSWEEWLPKVADQSIDLIFADPPYTNGSTGQEWDKEPVDLTALWAEYGRVIKTNGAIVLCSDMLFGARLIMSNLKWFKYDIIWQKGSSNSPGLAKLRPMPVHEHLLVFSPKKRKTTYNPQMRTGFKVWWKTNSRAAAGDTVQNRVVSYGYKEKAYREGKQSGERFPVSVVETSRPNYPLHPSQKPVELAEWVIKTYSNPGDLVLDNFAGSGTAGVAAINTDRKFILIEREPKYHAIAQARIDEARVQPRLNGMVG